MGAITTAQLRQVADQRIVGNVAGATGAAQQLTAAQVRTLCSVYSTSQVDTLLAAKANSATTLAGYGITDAITSAAVASGYQPLDADLTAIAALTTTTFGRSLLTQADAATARTTLGAGTGTIGGSVGATDNRLVRSDGTGTLTVQSTGITVDDSNNVSGVGTLAVGGTLTATTASAGTIAFSSLLVMTGSSQRVILRHISVPSVSYHAWGTAQYTTTSSNVIGFAPSSDPNTDPDTAIGRDSAGVLGIYTSNAKTTKGGLTCGAITSDALMCAGAYTVATLPSASANTGKFAQVTDSSVTTFGSTVSGGGSNRVPVFSNGTNWVVA